MGCGSDGRCVPMPDHVGCGDGVDCTEDRCDPLAMGRDVSGCVHRPMNALCPDDASDCTTASCQPRLAAADPTTGCVQVPNDALCRARTEADLGCGDVICVGDDAHASYGPALGGCAFTLDSAICSDHAHCVFTGMGTACQPIGTTGGTSACTEDSMCDDGNVCNGAERCLGATTRLCSRGLAMITCALPLCGRAWCDLSTGGTCAVREDPVCTTP
jgi:hypothetical protein